jgi:L-ascorbate metabolism protein UlaG (beta-lactamase superfamily)
MIRISSIVVVAVAVIATAIVTGRPAAAAELASDTLPTAEGPLVIHPVEHASFVMTWRGAVVIVDPVGDAARYTGHGEPDLVLLTHVHGDHTSPETLAALVTEATLIIAPASVAAELGDGLSGRVAILAHGETAEASGVTVEALPAYNLTEDRLAFHPRDRKDNSYVVSLADTRLFISGDSEDVPEMRALEDIDAAFVCMNLPYTMTVERAADAVLAFAPKIVYPYHYRGKGGLSDLETFTALVAKNPAIEVRILDWY